MGILRLLSCLLSSRKGPVSLQAALLKNNRLVVLFIVVILKWNNFLWDQMIKPQWCIQYSSFLLIFSLCAFMTEWRQLCAKYPVPHHMAEIFRWDLCSLIILLFFRFRVDDDETYCRAVTEYARACSHAGSPVRDWRDDFPACSKTLQ